MLLGLSTALRNRLEMTAEAIDLIISATRLPGYVRAYRGENIHAGIDVCRDNRRSAPLNTHSHYQVARPTSHVEESEVYRECQCGSRTWALFLVVASLVLRLLYQGRTLTNGFMKYGRHQCSACTRYQHRCNSKGYLSEFPHAVALFSQQGSRLLRLA